MIDFDASGLKYDEKGLLPAIAVDNGGVVLMLAYMNREAVELTINTGKAHYYSRSRQCMWLKGETSGNYQLVQDISYDCDKDTLLLTVIQNGVACHTGSYSCFGKTESRRKSNILYNLYNVISDRKTNPKEGSYTNYLLDKGIDKILKKVGEEASEVVIASKNDDKSEIIYETADLLYHLSVMLFDRGVCLDDVFDELIKRYT